MWNKIYIKCTHNKLVIIYVIDELIFCVCTTFTDYNLPQQKVYSLAGHVLALKNNVAAIEQLIKCCRSSGAPNAHIISDHVLAHCVKLLLTYSYTEQIPTLKHHIDILIRLIIDTELRVRFISIYSRIQLNFMICFDSDFCPFDMRSIIFEI